MSKGITVGMDMGDKNHRIVTLDSSGEVTDRRWVSNTAPALRKHFKSLEPCRLALEAGTPRAQTEYVAPRDETERRITEIFRLVLRCERVGALDDFFALGGNSLLSTQAIARLRASFEIELPLRALFEAPTPAGLAARVRAAAPAIDVTIERAPRDEPLALSFTQQRPRSSMVNANGCTMAGSDA